MWSKGNKMTVNSILTAYLLNNSHFKSLSQETSNQQIRFVMIRIEFVFSHFKSIPLGASGEVFRNQTKGEKASSFWEV
jgi:hypothetical protein